MVSEPKPVNLATLVQTMLESDGALSDDLAFIITWNEGKAVNMGSGISGKYCTGFKTIPGDSS